MKIGYYPGCTLKTKAKNLEDSALASLEALGVEVVEIERWNCCGAVYNLADDDLIHYLAPVRDLIRAKDQGFDTIVTLCSMCYNTLARANILMSQDEEKRNTLNTFMEEESDYAGEVKVMHMLPFLRDEIGWDKVREAVSAPLTDLKLAPYYGCTLTRPRDIEIDDSPDPQIFEDFVAALGATAVPFNEAETCCGSYNILSNPDAAINAVANILSSADKQKPDAMILSCPLCEYNLSRHQGDVKLPVFYFTQLMALALGLDPEKSRFDLNPEASRIFLEEQGRIAPASN